MTILHLALAADWETAQTAGDYRISTLGRTLEQEGFIHACADHTQLQGVVQRFYHDVGQALVLLTIDPAGLDVRMETPADSTEAFPHIYQPLPLRAVVSAVTFPLG
ncbi:DUF952 domain-containing protein [Streptosporangium canum]|uniref:DUF952 domain-containing protein n=1 Tax=Streptosporangium canum TaxID=324952 RepID=UPI0033BA82DA